VHRQYVAGGTVAPAPEADPVDRTDPVILGIEGTRRIFTGEYAEAVTLLREAVAMPHDDDVRALSLNNLAWALLL
jgi:Flp pilus assembly protein TadD